jgi:hypothetical protein
LTRLVQIAVLVQLGLAAAVVAADAPGISILAPAVLAVGARDLALAVHRLRHPGWRETRWWRTRPVLRFLVDGSLGFPGFQGRAGQSFIAGLQLLAGVVMTVIGAMLLLAIAA